jgi:hypothetical protein
MLLLLPLVDGGCKTEQVYTSLWPKVGLLGVCKGSDH